MQHVSNLMQLSQRSQAILKILVDKTKLIFGLRGR